MFRKHFRIRRVVLGLAFAAFAAPTAQAAGTFVDGGPVPVSRATTGSQLSYMSYHQVGGPLAAPAKVITPLQADGMRWQAMADAYKQQQVITPLQADGMRWQAMADAYRQQQASVAISERSFGVPGPDPSLVPQVVSATSNSFDWQDAGIGASTAFGVALLLVIAVAIMRRNQHTGLTNA